ncbi:MAG: isoprenoid biosynthesis glyoxalase ElbB [Planctomycetota bacterium]
MSLRVGVLLSGCGYLDGSEIHEAVLTMLHLDRSGATIVCTAPRGPQALVVDHATGKPAEGQSRGMLIEAARIARGRIKDLAEVRAGELDALICPGGFGAARNLCDFASRGEDATPHPEVARLLRELHAARKPIGAICIAPAMVACVLGREVHPTLTIGSDKGTARALEAMGSRHRECSVRSCVVDEENLIVTTPAYMCDARISEVSAGIEKLISSVLGLCKAGAKTTKEGA